MRIFNNGAILYSGTLDDNKQIGIDIIDDWFEGKQRNNKLTTSLGFRIDNRRSGEHNDLDNIKNLLLLGIYVVRDADNIMRQITKEQVETLIAEMSYNGLVLYEFRWTWKDEILKSTSIEEVWHKIDLFQGEIE